MVEEIAGYRIVSFDGEDANGVRAEVYVQVGTGTVEAIKLGSGGASANIEFKSSNPKIKKNPKGWIRVDSPQYEKLLEAEKSHELVKYRIESSRKSSVPRDTKIADTDPTEERLARVVSVNDSLTSEALTDPNEDERFVNVAHSAVGTYHRESTPTPDRRIATASPYNPASKEWRSLAASFSDFFPMVANVIVGDKGYINVELPDLLRTVASLSGDFNKVVRAVIEHTHPEAVASSSDYSVGTRGLAYALIRNVHPIDESVIMDETARKNWMNALYVSLRHTVVDYDLVNDGAPAFFPGVNGATGGTAKETESEPDTDTTVSSEANESPFLIPLGTVLGGGAMSDSDETDRMSELCRESGASPSGVVNLLRATYGVTRVKQVPKSQMDAFLSTYDSDHDAFKAAVLRATADWDAR